MKKSLVFAFSIFTAVALVSVLVWRIHGDQAAARSDREASRLVVDTIAVRRADVPLALEAVGQVEPEHTVAIRPQVAGKLQQVDFAEGDEVKAGQALFRIDPAPFEAALASARAAYASAKANLDRLTSLEKTKYITPQDYQNAKAAAAKAEADVRQAEINLSYTDIRAPITGRTGAISMKSGNIVSPSDSQPLVTINQIRPILVRFAIAQQDLERVRRYRKAAELHARITHEDGSGDLGEGTLVFVDNGVNPDAATVTLKLRAPNTDATLWPGEYVGVHLVLALEHGVLAIPQAALQTGQNGAFVYRVEGGKAEYAPVHVAREAGDLAVIDNGLKAGDQVVLRVPRRLRAGSPVTPQPVTGADLSAAGER